MASGQALARYSEVRFQPSTSALTCLRSLPPDLDCVSLADSHRAAQQPCTPSGRNEMTPIASIRSRETRCGMDCPSCKTKNPDDGKSCIQCGALLPVACRSCGHRHVWSAKFCANCGIELAIDS